MAFLTFALASSFSLLGTVATVDQIDNGIATVEIGIAVYTVDASCLVNPTEGEPSTFRACGPVAAR